jgi:hypothetical protein
MVRSRFAGPDADGGTAQVIKTLRISIFRTLNVSPHAVKIEATIPASGSMAH